MNKILFLISIFPMFVAYCPELSDESKGKLVKSIVMSLNACNTKTLKLTDPANFVMCQLKEGWPKLFSFFKECYPHLFLTYPSLFEKRFHDIFPKLLENPNYEFFEELVKE